MLDSSDAASAGLRQMHAGKRQLACCAYNPRLLLPLAAEAEKQQRDEAAAAQQQRDAAAELLAQLEAARRGKAVGSAAAEPQLDEQQQKQPG